MNKLTLNKLKLNKVTIIGVGLIGGSFAMGLKEAGLVKTTCGCGSRESNLQKGVELGVIDSYSLSIEEAVQDADLVFLAVPLGAMEDVLKQIKPYLSEKTIITDGGSAKMSVVNAVKSVFGDIPSQFIAGHPIAGKEKSGVTAAEANLYQGHRVLLTPTAETDPQATALVSDLWTALGAEVTEMSPEYHDEVLAATSHLPHLLAYGLVDMLNEHEELGNVFQYTAGGFRDFTRIASSDATMWRDIALNNKQAILKWLQNYQQGLSHLTELIEAEDGVALHQLFDNAKQARDKHILPKQP